MKMSEIFEARLVLGKDMMTVSSDENQPTRAPLKLRGFGSRVRDHSEPAAQMIDKIDTDYEPNPLNHRQYVFDNLAVFEIRRDLDFDDAVELNDVRAMAKGGGAACLKMLCDLADSLGVTINLYAQGYAQVPTLKLVEYYGRMGFEVLSPHQIEQARKYPQEGVDMRRKPR